MEEKYSSMAIVMTENKKVLVLNCEGEWVFPKGHVESGESFIQAAIRELYEEAGVVVLRQESVGQVDEFSFYFKGEEALKVIKVFGFKIQKEQKILFNQSEGFIDGKWVDFDEARHILTHADAKGALEKCVKKAF